MNLKFLIPAILIFLITPVMADTWASNYTLQTGAMGGVGYNYTIQYQNATASVYTNIPITTESIAYPIEFFYMLFGAGLIFLLLGIMFLSNCKCVPSVAITITGFIAFGLFLVASYMSPHTASTTMFGSATSFGNDTILLKDKLYIMNVNMYMLSPWVAYLCNGLASMSFLTAIAGVLSFFGVFQRWGLKNAQKGKYIEMDTDDKL